ncbi:MAG: carbohydrate binding family 9 domain-containing protein, partial [Gemmatimonadaceae bacterium]
MKILVLFALIASQAIVMLTRPITVMAQTSAQAESVTARVASTAPEKIILDAPAIGSRATATAAMASRATTAPVLDGKTDDPAWQTAQVIDQFLEYDPKKGVETRFKTEVRVTYDDRNLYVLARMYDPAPDSIVSLLSRRDVRTASEQLKLMIDSYHDRRTGYEFCVNPAGVKRDFYVYNDNNEDQTWDGVWDVATRIDSLGWVAEFRIPFSQLRFNNKDEHTFGFMVVRDVARTSARISWPLYDRDKQGYFSQLGDLGGIRGLSAPRRLELTPYVVTKNETRPSGSS